MPGVLGMVGCLASLDPQSTLHAMANAASHDPSYRTDLICAPDCALGRVGPGLLNTGAQPVWSDDGAICLVMEGELYDTAAEWRKLEAQGVRPRQRSDAELMLQMYRTYGEPFAATLNGSFAAALWEPQHKRLVLVADRLGSYRICYARVRDRLIFGPNLHVLLVDPGLRQELDLVAVGQTLVLDHMLDDRTLLADVRLVPPSSVLVYEGGEPVIKQYWQIRFPTEYPLRDEDEYVEEFLSVLRQAVARQAAGDTRQAGMFLSGGLDSRALAAVAEPGMFSRPLLTLTWGQPGCDDGRFAQEVAHKLGLANHFLPLEPCDLPRIAEQGVRITDGGNVVHFHALAVLEQALRYANVLYKGVVGDAIMGTALTRLFWSDYSPAVMTQAHLKAHRDRGVLLFLPEQLPRLMGQATGEQVAQEVLAAYAKGMQDAGSGSMADQRIYFDMRQRVRRMTLNGVDLVRSRAVVRTPFCDNDFMDYAFRLPAGLRLERHVVQRALIASHPALAQIPLTGPNLPLQPGLRDTRIRAQRVVAWHLHRLRMRRESHVARRPYANHDLWFRTALRPWVEDVLLSPRSLQRGLFDPAFVKSLLADQMRGGNHAVQIGALMALELWQRQFLD